MPSLMEPHLRTFNATVHKAARAFVLAQCMFAAALNLRLKVGLRSHLVILLPSGWCHRCLDRELVSIWLVPQLHLGTKSRRYQVAINGCIIQTRLINHKNPKNVDISVAALLRAP